MKVYLIISLMKSWSRWSMGLVLCFVLLANTSIAQECDVIYVSPSGATSGAAGTRTNPASLLYGLTLVTPTETRIWMATGTYNISNTLVIPNDVTLEGGFNVTSWIKSNGVASVIMRDNLNSVPANALIGLQAVGASGFRLQDLTVTVANSPVVETPFMEYILKVAQAIILLGAP